MPNSKINKNENSKSKLTTVIIHCLNNLDQKIITEYLNGGEKHLVYTTQDQLDKLFTIFSNQEKEQWKVFRDAFGRYNHWKRKNLDLVAIWTQFTKESFKGFLEANEQSAHYHYGLPSYSWNCLTKHKESWKKFKENFRSIRNSELLDLFYSHGGGSLGPWLQTFQLGEFKNAWKADINACYNYHLGNSPLPVGNYQVINKSPEIKEALAKNKLGILYFQLISSNNFYRGQHYPWFPSQQGDKKTWPNQIPAGTYLIHTCLLPHLLSDYSLNIRYLKLFAFEHKAEVLQDFSNYYYDLKSTHRKGSWQNIIGKAVPNLVVGKFGQHQYNYVHEWVNGKLTNKKKKQKRGGDNFDHLMVTIHAHALVQVLEEMKKYSKEDLLAVRTDCLILKNKPIHTDNGENIGQWKVKEIQEANFYDANRIDLDGELLAHGFKILERREKSVLVERQYYKEDGHLETKRYWKEL